MLRMNRLIAACCAWALLAGAAFGAAVTPAVNAPLLSMAGGTAPSTIWSTTARQTIASTSDVSCFSATGQGPGLTIPANGAYAGNQYQLNCSGVYSVPALNAATVVFKLKWAATSVATSGSILPSSAVATNLAFTMQATCTVISIGASGSMECLGQVCFSAGLVGAALSCGYFITPSAQTIDTTAASKIDVTAAWSSVAGGQTATAIVAGALILF